jgi:F0F1-type ATP synthase membrane subunit c/vacuolar-type H+-ATPase subunit K
LEQSSGVCEQAASMSERAKSSETPADAPARKRAGLADALARWRVGLGFVCAGVVFWLAEPTPFTIASGGAIAGAGEGLRVWAAGHLYKSREVTASGPYRWFAHPLYVGSSAIGAGVAVASASAAAAVLIGAYLVATLTATIRSEEASLRRLFGDRYDQYRLAGEVDRRRRFSLAQAMANGEHRALIGLVAALLLLAAKATYNGMFWRTAAGP